MNTLGMVLSGSTPANTGSSTMFIVVYILIFAAIIYFMMIRPQKKQKAKTEEMHNQMEPGDNIMTTSGFYGTILDIVDDNGIPTGKTVERKTAHREGIQHRTAHLWIARKKCGNIELLLQKRCMEKDSFPGCYDISSAGHIPAGMDYVPSALRELREELGVTAKEEDLIFCGKKRVTVTSEFHEHPYTDRQVCNVYLMWLDREAEDFVVQKEEIDSVMWMEYQACRKVVIENTIPNCIDIEELDMLEEHFHDI